MGGNQQARLGASDGGRFAFALSGSVCLHCGVLLCLLPVLAGASQPTEAPTPRPIEVVLQAPSPAVATKRPSTAKARAAHPAVKPRPVVAPPRPLVAVAKTVVKPTAPAPVRHTPPPKAALPKPVAPAPPSKPESPPPQPDPEVDEERTSDQTAMSSPGPETPAPEDEDDGHWRHHRRRHRRHHHHHRWNEDEQAAAEPPVDPMNHDARPIGPDPTLTRPAELDGVASIRVEVQIDRDGNTTVALLTPTGDQTFDQTLPTMLKSWRWNPAVKHGIPVESKKEYALQLSDTTPSPSPSPTE